MRSSGVTIVPAAYSVCHMSSPNHMVVCRPRYRFRTLFALVSLVCMILGLVSGWQYLPGTFFRGGNGLPYGSGKEQEYYATGALKCESRYRGGFCVEATWFSPEGDELYCSRFDREAGGICYYLFEDGSIKAQVPSRFDEDRVLLADGMVEFYNRDGTVERRVMYVRGVPKEVSEQPEFEDGSGRR